jgi:predicted metal-dependent phosphoesterase TrpH
MGRADIHIHSAYSGDCTTSVEAILFAAANRPNLDVIAITDHDSMDGAFKALELAPHFGVQVIPGCEISTSEGHLLALFIHKFIRPGMPLAETLHQIGEQGGIAVAPHPTAPIIHSLSAESIGRVVRQPDLRQILVGVETINAGNPYLPSHWRGYLIQAATGLSAMGNSDAHAAWVVGAAVTEFPGSTPEDLRAAVIAGHTRALRDKRAPILKVALTRFFHDRLRRKGLSFWTSAPDIPLQYKPLEEVLLPLPLQGSVQQ